MELSSNEIEKILPHRWPMLLIDRVTACEPGKCADAVKCISAGAIFFQGHFPGYHVLPGVLIVEAMAQTGAVALLTEEGAAGSLVFLGGIKNARFRRQVVPGDRLEIHVEITRRIGRIGFGRGTASVDGTVAAEAEISYAIHEREKASAQAD